MEYFLDGTHMRHPADKGGNAVEAARSLYRQRRIRDETFGPGLFGEPAWDLLLELYLATSEQRPVSVTSAAIAASVSTEAAAQWLLLLEEHGLVDRLYAGEMNRAVVSLSDTAFDQMTHLLQQMISSTQ
jgi:hypothetical protein